MDEDLKAKIDELHRVNNELLGKKPKPKNNMFKILSITFVAILYVGVMTNFYGVEYTGNIVKEVKSVSLSEFAYKDSRYEFFLNKEVEIRSAKISGTIYGDGTVNVFLKTPTGNKLVYASQRLEHSVPKITGFAVLDGSTEPVDVNPTIIVDNSEDFTDTQEARSNNYPEFNVKVISANVITKEKLMNVVDINFDERVEVDLKITENIRYKEIFEATKIENIYEILNECEQTCVIYPILSNKYEFIFDIEEGTALKVKTIDFS